MIAYYYLELWISLDITRYYLVVGEHFFSAQPDPHPQLLSIFIQKALPEGLRRSAGFHILIYGH